MMPETIDPAAPYDAALERAMIRDAYRGPGGPDETCRTCRFWRVAPELRPDDEDGEPLEAECRRHAPRAVATPYDRRECDFDDRDQDAHWPLTYVSDWCGEWAALHRPS